MTRDLEESVQSQLTIDDDDTIMQVEESEDDHDVQPRRSDDHDTQPRRPDNHDVQPRRSNDHDAQPRRSDYHDEQPRRSNNYHDCCHAASRPHRYGDPRDGATPGDGLGAVREVRPSQEVVLDGARPHPILEVDHWESAGDPDSPLRCRYQPTGQQRPGLAVRRYTMVGEEAGAPTRDVDGSYPDNPRDGQANLSTEAPLPAFDKSGLDLNSTRSVKDASSGPRDGNATTISIFYRHRRVTVCRAHARFKERCYACGNPERCEWSRYFSDQVSHNLRCYTITSQKSDRVAVVCNNTRKLFLINTGSCISILDAAGVSPAMRRPVAGSCTTVTGEPFRIYEPTQLTIKINHRTYTHDFFVVDLGINILGADFLRKYDLKVDLTKKVLIDTKAGDYLSCVPMDRLAYIHAIAKKRAEPPSYRNFRKLPNRF
ncbi:hypothetical protein Ciccas_012055 [Cichlidogyrus casuarinus]|uniref:Peptidase A2 domain-containing protein n=1 Tax=Cichlidogyrus casuarinus TaxID=1844966 RepID=A0ABD2PQ76_9PLAT